MLCGMKTPKILLAALLPVLGCAGEIETETTEPADTALSASEGDERHHERFERLAERLQLTAEQAEAARPILEAAHERRRALRDLPRDERRDAARALHARTHEQLAAILTPEQLEALERHHRRRGRHGPRHRGGPEAMAEELGLTDAQRSAVRAVFDGARDRHRAIRDLPEDERHAAREALHADVRQQLSGVLDETQLAAFDARRPGPERFLAHLTDRLELTEAQRGAARPILERAHERRLALRDLPRPERREAARALHEQVRAELATVLTEEQLAGLDELGPPGRHRHGHGRHEGPRGRGPRGGGF